MIRKKAIIEVFMKHKSIFPYDYLNERKNELNEENKYNIYYVLKGDKYIIKSINILDQYNFTVLIDNKNLNTCTVMPLSSKSFQVPDMHCIQLEIVDNGSILQVDFTKKGMSFLNSYAPEFIKENQWIIKKYGHIRVQYHVKVLIDMFRRFLNIETMEEYEILYIGQTQKNNIFDRLYEHNTIPEIMRDQNRDNNGNKYEIYIMVTGVHIKFISQFDNEQSFLTFIGSETLQDDFLIKKGLITKSEVIKIAEAILILYFKPRYNDKLKNTKKPEILSTYKIFNDCLINQIAYSLDLYFEDIKHKIILKTDENTAVYKQNLLKCAFDKNGKVESIILEHLFNDEYL